MQYLKQLEKLKYEKKMKQNKSLIKKISTNPKKVTRIEVIDENGRSYTNWSEYNSVELSIQDNGKTLKIFIKNDKPKSLSENKNLNETVKN